jgi:hypothetical protein
MTRTLALFCALCLILAASTGCRTIGDFLFGEEVQREWEGYPESLQYRPEPLPPGWDSAIQRLNGQPDSIRSG